MSFSNKHHRKKKLKAEKAWECRGQYHEKFPYHGYDKCFEHMSMLNLSGVHRSPEVERL
ncbi:hypothetical protein DPMN_013912 [Dreissena polymorpha]|uniref:Uncharacterized protein n=1 Tax=Dreissena polymorpha TaxID=45954 RepID=A0A9D4S4R3_DREPO|nr:hypothetical protein DPMN_013912 [Dreissena polymorpha]